jgi:dTDP-4-dehydrorhamnose 3,5-epimerase
MFELLPTRIDGCVVLRPRMARDERGSFVKTVHRDFFTQHGLASDFAESYYSISRRGVLRGMHLQMPPHDHAKLVYCVRGSVQDAVLDLRKGSPTEGRHALVELSAEAGTLIYIGVGLAHGYYVQSKEAIVMYHVTTVYAPESDAGVRWNSAGIPWPVDQPILSPRDRALPALADFNSPFVYSAQR